MHSAACEAAVAVRLARAAGREPEVTAWLWAHQKNLTRETVFSELDAAAGQRGVESQYPAVLAMVRSESEIGTRLAVHATPAFWVNGVILSSVSLGSFRWAVDHELATAR